MILFLPPVLFIFGMVGALFTFPRRGPHDWRRLPLLLLLLIPPVASYLWGQTFEVVPGTYNPKLPFWVEGFLLVALAVSIALPLTISRQLLSVRSFTYMLGLAMVGLTALMGMLADCEVTGSWP